MDLTVDAPNAASDSVAQLLIFPIPVGGVTIDVVDQLDQFPFGVALSAVVCYVDGAVADGQNVEFYLLLWLILMSWCKWNLDLFDGTVADVVDVGVDGTGWDVGADVGTGWDVGVVVDLKKKDVDLEFDLMLQNEAVVDVGADICFGKLVLLCWAVVDVGMAAALQDLLHYLAVEPHQASKNLQFSWHPQFQHSLRIQKASFEASMQFSWAILDFVTILLPCSEVHPSARMLQQSWRNLLPPASPSHFHTFLWNVELNDHHQPMH
jgi:hypothetical protein